MQCAVGRARRASRANSPSFRRVRSQSTEIRRPLNAASIHVMKKLGMHFEKNARYYGIDAVQYEISRDEFKRDNSRFVILPDEES